MTHAATRHDGDLRDSAVAVKDAVVDLASEAGRYAGDRVSDAKESAAAMLDTVKSKAGDYNDTVVGLIRKNPYKSLAIAAGIGFVAGALIKPRW